MADGRAFATPLTPAKPAGIRNRLMASARFQKWAARFPLTRGLVKKEGAALFDLIAGFCHSQTLMALAELQVPEALLGGPLDIDDLAAQADIPPLRMDILVQAGAAIGILKRRSNRVSLTQRGAAFATVPGLSAMVRHHRAFYDVQTLMDVGGGTGAFLSAVGQAYPDLRLRLFDLPAGTPAASERFERTGLTDRSDIVSGSFRDQELPEGADMISLVRVLYDHSDETVQDLLAKAFRALPSGGRIVVSEPMSGGRSPDKATDGYFALYTLAMQTGRTRSADHIALMLANAGFSDIKQPRPLRSYVTSVVTAVKSA